MKPDRQHFCTNFHKINIFLYFTFLFDFVNIFLVKIQTSNLFCYKTTFILFMFCDMCEKPFVLMLILIHHL